MKQIRFTSWAVFFICFALGALATNRALAQQTPALVDASTGALKRPTAATFISANGFAASATTDTTNAANITSGTLPNARIVALPNANLANSAVTIGSTSVSLGATASTIAGLTLTTPTIGAATFTSLTQTNGATITDPGTGALKLAAVAAQDLSFAPGASLAGTWKAGGNLLLGTTTDSSNGRLQLATHTTSAGGIGFGVETSLYRAASGNLVLQRTAGQAKFSLVDTGGTTYTPYIAGTYSDNALEIGVNSTPLIRSKGFDTPTSITVLKPLNVTDTTASSSTTTGSATFGGGIGVAGAGYFGGAVTAAGISTSTTYNDKVTALTYASPTSVTVTSGNVFTVTTVNATGSVTFNASGAGTAGQHMYIIITNDATSGKVITFGTNFKSSGTLTGTQNKSSTIHFLSDGANWYEISRTVGSL